MEREEIVIDSKYLTIQGELVEIPAADWTGIVDRFANKLIEAHAVYITSTGGYKIGQPDTYVYCPINRWQAVEIVGNAIGDQKAEEAIWYSCSKQLSRSVSDEYVMDHFFEDLFNILKKDHVVVKALKEYATTQHLKQVQELKERQDYVQQMLTVHYDEECGIEPKWLVPDKHPAQLYFMLGFGMYFIPDVRTFSMTDKLVRIGTFSS
jgi:hypothetical protein